MALGASIVTSFLAIYLDINSKMSKELRTFGANFFIGSKTPQKSDFLKQDVLQKIMKDLDPKTLVGGSGLIYGIVRLDLGNAILSGIDFKQARAINPFWQVEGSWINVAFDDVNCMVGKSLAKNMELKIGSMVTVRNTKTGFSKKLKVKGIIETGLAEDNQIFTNLDLAQKILDYNGLINYATLSLKLDPTSIEDLARKINAKFPSVDAKPIRKVSFSEGKILNKIKGLMAMIAAMILIITTICVNATLIATVRQRAKEIGLQKAIGASNAAIIKQFLSEVCIVSVLGIIFGVFGGYILAQVMGKAIFDATIDMRSMVIPITFLISFLASIIAALMPMRSLLNIFPAQVLRGE